MHCRSARQQPTRWLSIVRSALMFSCFICVSFSGCREDNDAAPVNEFELLSPEDKASEVSVRPTFRWSEAIGADAYTLIIARDEGFTQDVISIDGITATEVTLPEALLAGYRYHWKVVAQNSASDRTAANAGISFRTLGETASPSPAVSVYYVSPQGDDNPDRGTIELPFRTLAYAATRVPANESDTIMLMEGTFVETEPAVIPTGVHVKGAGQDKTILKSAGVTIPEGINPGATDFHLLYEGTLIQLVSPHKQVRRNPSSASYPPANGNQTLSDFSIDGSGKNLKAGVWVENRNDVAMHHVTIKDCQLRGAVFAPGNKDWYEYPEYYMTGVKIHDCVFKNSGKDLPDQSLGNLNLAQLDGAEIYNVTIDDNEGYGIKFIYDGYFKNVNIHDCTITLNEVDAKWGEDIAIELWNVGPGNKIRNIRCNTWLSVVNHAEIFGDPSGAVQMKIDFIHMKDKDGVSNKEAIEAAAPGIEISDSYFENKGFGIAIWDMGRSDITVRNNVFYNTQLHNNWASGAAVYIDNSRTWDFKNIRVYNNVFDMHPVAVRVKGLMVKDVYIRNNAFINTATADVQAEGTNIVATHNLKFTAGNLPWVMTGVTTESNNITGNPQYLFTGAADDTYYKPSSASSFAVDKGTDVGLPYAGAAPDIGYSEFDE